MRLKRLEMVGFKSFAEKTRVDFEAGITAIVGPNGCGKSNISDAIRWSLGEMSAKSLRSQQMMDVIFNGTAHRASQGMSEVALTFDNSSGQIPIDFTEVTIARRLFRSGESEYFINKTQCRLKDLRDLFLDTGVGNDGYYVMAQGKIEFILGSKPEERRELFEEAAGVSKYKVRREEALRRLNKVEQDMLRLNDSLAIYKQQIDALDSAVRKARQHQKLQEDLRTLEIASLLHSHEHARVEWETTESLRLVGEQTLAALRADVARRETALSEARTKSESLEQDILDLQRQMAQSESDWAKTEAERQAAAERMTELNQLLARLEQEAVQLEAGLAQWRETRETLSAEVAEIRMQYHASHDRFKAEDHKGKAGQEDLLAQQKELEAMKSRLLELVRLISHHRNETVRLTSLSVRLDEAAKGKLRELEKVQSRRSALEQQLQQQESLAAGAQERLAAAEQALKAQDDLQRQDLDALAETDQQIQTTREQLARLDAEKIAMERWLHQDPVARAVSAMRHQTLPGIYGPISELFRTQGPFQRLLDRALGDRSQFFIADTLNDAQAAIRYLSDERQGWATFFVLDRVSQMEQQATLGDTPASRSLADVVECDEKFRPVLRALLGRTFYLGETLFEEGLLRGGAEPEGARYQATPTDLGRLLQDLHRHQNDLEAFQSRRVSLKATLAERDQAREPLQAARNQVLVEAQVQRESLGRLRDDQQMVDTEARLLHQEREESVNAIEQTRVALEKEEILLTTLEQEELTLEQSVQTHDAALQDLRLTIQTQQASITHLRLEAEALRERLLGKEKESDNALGRLTAVEQRLTQVQTERAESVDRLTQLTVLQKEKADWLLSLQSTRQIQQTTMTGLLDLRQEIQGRLHAEDEELSQAREKLENAQRQTQEAEFQARTLDQEKTRFAQTLQDTYQLSIEEAKVTHSDVQPNPDELSRIRRRLESLGAVNLAAPEEHAQLEERYHFLLSQQQDLLKAKEDLHQAIAKINATTREHFRATFEQVRTNFRSLYQQLFQGGEADLILTDEHNLLETGVDIMAQPPGKKLQNIALLSGGEKALTAIALLFAFFLVKPSPFCLLDEVDAPLDEANVGRFLNIVKTFSEKTQFIIITHNKRTMEMADVLYGVTMAELGVSSLISVKLESAKPPEPVAA